MSSRGDSRSTWSCGVTDWLGTHTYTKESRWLPVARGASEFTNPVSYIGHKLFRGANLRFKVLGINRLFGIAGRFVPYVGAAIAVYDVAQIIDKQAKCYEKATSKD
jgi:hypothetical protein